MLPFLYRLLCFLVIFKSICVDACSFPQHWRDSWVKSGFNTNVKLSITHSSITSSSSIPFKGRCISSKPEEKKYLLMRPSSEDDDTKGSGTCYSCLVFSTRHVNVIQLKAALECISQSSPTDNSLFDRLCNSINADSTLHTLVKEHAVPISCPEPLQGPLTFRYDGGSSSCGDESTSTVSKCSSSTQLHIKYEQCPQLGYDQEEVKVQCLATWKNSGNWLYVKYGANDYRCINYDVTSQVLGMTSDASCTGIAIIFSSPNIFQWTVVPYSEATAECTYPTWFTRNDWTDLQGEFVYRYDVLGDELVVDKQVRSHNSYTETSQRHVCHQKSSDTNSEIKFITKSINDCDHGYQCVVFRYKSESVIEITIGEMSTQPAEACSNSKLVSALAETRLLINSNAPQISCPVSGKYIIKSSPTSCPINMEIGCSQKNSISIKECDMTKAELVCLASWQDQGENRLVISKPSYPRSGNCYTYKIEDGFLVLNMDKQCNYGAPFILNGSIPEPPYQLPRAERKCGLEQSDITSDYDKQTRADIIEDDGESNSCNVQYTNYVIMTALTTLWYIHISLL